MPARFAALLLLIAVSLGGCGSPEPPQAEAAAKPAAAPAPPPLPAGWNEFSPGGETTCSDGSDYKFFARPGNPEKLLVYLQGGGGCWTRHTCDEQLNPSYNIRVGEFHPQNYDGIFNFDNPDNPFSDHSVVFAPYCTGDVHIGASDTVYDPVDETGQPLTIHHQGFANVAAVLEFTRAQFPSASEIFVTGSSAGSIPSPYYTVKIAESYPDARIAQLGDGAGGYRVGPDDSLPHAQWGTVPVLNQHPAWGEEADETFNYERLYIGAAKHLPNVQFAEYDTAEDDVQKRFLGLFGIEGVQLIDNLDANYADIRAEVDNFVGYIAGGELHTILGRPEFYTYTVGERSVRDWVADLAAGHPVSDVRCEECSLPEIIGGYPQEEQNQPQEVAE